jgi:hypothetical protein
VLSRSAFVAFGVVACSGKPANAPASGSTWCEHVPLSTNSKGDRTRFDNTAERVIKVKNDLHVEALGCGAYYVGVSSDAIMAAVIHSQPLPDGPGFVPNEDPSHCIMVYLTSDAPKPVANPLYADGVRVYFIDDAIRAKVAQADAKATWCTDVPFSSDPTSDRTGVDNTEERVNRILKAAGAAIRACPNVTDVKRSLAKTAIADLKLDSKPPQGGESKTWVIRVTLSKDAPNTNPLYLDGVRTYFEVPNAPSALPPPPPPPP